MSKNELLAFAKGEKLKRNYNVRFLVDNTGKIVIQDVVLTNCKPICFGFRNSENSLSKREITEKELYDCVDEYIKAGGEVLPLW